jgi:hypothetical protein
MLSGNEDREGLSFIIKKRLFLDDSRPSSTSDEEDLIQAQVRSMKHVILTSNFVLDFGEYS